MNGNRRWVSLDSRTLQAMNAEPMNFQEFMQDTQRQTALAAIELTKKQLANPSDWIITVSMTQEMPGEIICSVELTPILVTQTFTIDNGK